MTVRIEKTNRSESIIRRVKEISDVDFALCYQCRKCTSGCPVAASAKTPPSEIIRRLHLGAGDEILKSDIIWLCASCETCSTRCPMEINIAAVMDALRSLALEKGISKPKGSMPLFNRAFLKTVRLFGRTYDLGMIAAYKTGTLTFLRDTDKFPAMLKKGKIALLPHLSENRKAVNRIFRSLRSGTRNKGNKNK